MDARSSAGEPRVLINRESILHNARVIRQAVGPKVSICAVIKADAYGHGASVVCETLCDYVLDEFATPPVNALAVATIDEALVLPEPSLPVLVLRPVENALIGRQRQQIEQAIRNGWIMTLCSGAAVDDIARIAMAMETRAYVQIMIDTGMSRSGVPEADFADLAHRVQGHVSLRLFGLCTHFACSEDDGDPFTKLQHDRFCKLTDDVVAHARSTGVNIVRHCANSGAIFSWPQTYMDMVRPGLSLYGIDPASQSDPALPLRPAMKWTANILMTRDVRQGTGVGYGQTWQAPRDSRLGLVPVGYADGYMRAWSNRAVMMVGGSPAPVVGRISMDMTMIDLTNIPDAAAGDEVVIMDDDPDSPASVYRLARLGDTIPYEVFCHIGSRVHRVGVGEPKLEEAITHGSNQS